MSEWALSVLAMVLYKVQEWPFIEVFWCSAEYRLWYHARISRFIFLLF